MILDLAQLLNREPVHARIMDELIYPNLPSDPAAIFTLLLGAGFVTVAKNTENADEGREREISLAIPNKEVSQVYEDEILATLRRTDYREQTLRKIRAALISGSDSELQDGLRTLLLRHVSSMDVSTDHKEYAYHMLLLGLFLPLMGHYSVTSNAESGDGRYDICLSPRRRMDPGIIIELKWEADASDDRLKELASEALAQIDENNYKASLERDGVRRIFRFGVAFCAKHVQVALAVDNPEEAESKA